MQNEDKVASLFRWVYVREGERQDIVPGMDQSEDEGASQMPLS